MFTYLSSFIWAPKPASTIPSPPGPPPPLTWREPQTKSSSCAMANTKRNAEKISKHTETAMTTHNVGQMELLSVKMSLRKTETRVAPSKFPSRIPHIEEMHRLFESRRLHKCKCD